MDTGKVSKDCFKDINKCVCSKLSSLTECKIVCHYGKNYEACKKIVELVRGCKFYNSKDLH